MITPFIKWLEGLPRVAQIALSVVAFMGFTAVAMPATSTPPTGTTKPEVQAVEITKEPVITTETTTETEAIPFGKRSVDTSALNRGESKVTTLGSNGAKTKTYTITKTNGVETNRVLMKEEVTTAPTDEITSVGIYVAPTPAPRASNCDTNYSPCVPNVSYDLDCADIGFSVRVTGSDPHGFDRDRDGYGCESY